MPLPDGAAVLVYPDVITPGEALRRSQARRCLVATGGAHPTKWGSKHQKGGPTQSTDLFLIQNRSEQARELNSLRDMGGLRLDSNHALTTMH